MNAGQWAIAFEMRAGGATMRQIGKKLGRSPTTIGKAFRSPEQAAASHAVDRETHRRWRRRQMARIEAAETGEPVEAIWKRWGVEMRRGK